MTRRSTIDPGKRPARGAAARGAGIVTLLTDFGSEDAYVASMKGVILGILPAARIVDVTHAIPPQDVRRGAIVLRSVVPWFPPGTVHVAVVDPGVGTSRASIVVAAGEALLVGPDNGLLDPAARLLAGRAGRRARAHVIDEGTLPAPSATFHGRDVFAPVAARLAAGASPRELGRPATSTAALDLPEPRRKGRRVEGEIVYVDRFGNLVTNIHEELLPGPREGCIVRVGDLSLRGVARTYGDALPRRPVALVESTGHLEIAVRDGSAAEILGISCGVAVAVEGRRC